MIKKFNIQKFIIILSMLNALYSAYLICHIDKYPIKSFIVIFVCMLLLFLGLLLFSKKNINKKIIDKKQKIILFILSILTTCFIIFTNFQFFTYSYVDTELTFTKENSKLEEENFINSVLINNTIYKKQGENFIEDSDSRINKNIKYEKVNNKYVLKVNKTYNIKIEFNDQANNIKLLDGNKAKMLHIKNGETYLYNVNSNSKFNNYSYIRLILSFELILYITLLIFFNILGTKDKKVRNFILTFLSIIFIGLLYRSNLISNVLYPDSASYIDYDFNKLFKLHLDGRTPIYPIIIRLIYLLFPNHYFSYVCTFQYILWFISLIYLYRLLILLTSNYKLTSIFTILYALSPAIVTWNNSIITESIALSGTIIFIYYVVYYLKENKLSSGIKAIIISFILTFHRPTSIILVLLLFIFLFFRLILEKQNRQKDFKCLVISLISILFIVGYAILFHRDYGIYSISDRAVRQNLYVSVSQKYYKSSNNKEFIKKVDKALEKNPDNYMNATWEVFIQYPLKDIKEITNYCRNKNLKKYSFYIVDLMKMYSVTRFEGYSYKNVNPNLVWMDNLLASLLNFITFGYAYIAIIIELILLVYRWIKNKKVPWLDCGLFAFPLIIIMSSFIGTNDEFMRTAICTVPFTFITYILLLHNIFQNKN